MPKEKASTRKTKAKAAETGGKRKKGEETLPNRHRGHLTLTSMIDPNAPKRGLSAYMFFANDNRDTVREENPGITFGMRKPSSCCLSPLLTQPPRIVGQVGKVLGEKWKALNSKQREPYETKAKADKERYESEKASYNNVSICNHFSMAFMVATDHALNNRLAMKKKRRSN